MGLSWLHRKINQCHPSASLSPQPHIQQQQNAIHSHSSSPKYGSIKRKRGGSVPKDVNINSNVNDNDNNNKDFLMISI